MTLTIKLRDIRDVDASSILEICTERLRDFRSISDPSKKPEIEFKYEVDTPTITYRGEDTLFTRYINNTKKDD